VFGRTTLGRPSPTRGLNPRSLTVCSSIKSLKVAFGGFLNNLTDAFSAAPAVSPLANKEKNPGNLRSLRHHAAGPPQPASARTPGPWKACGAGGLGGRCHSVICGENRCRPAAGDRNHRVKASDTARRAGPGRPQSRSPSVVMIGDSDSQGEHRGKSVHLAGSSNYFPRKM
jgi:hypothetical protein